MTKPKDGPAPDQGGAARPTPDESDRERDVTGSLAGKGEKPSPGRRRRGETAGAHKGGAIYFAAAHERAS